MVRHESKVCSPARAAVVRVLPSKPLHRSFDGDVVVGRLQAADLKAVRDEGEQTRGHGVDHLGRKLTVSAVQQLITRPGSTQSAGAPGSQCNSTPTEEK